MASTVKTPGGKWTCRIYIGFVDGVRKYKRFTADTKKEAERAAYQYLEEHPINPSRTDMTVADAIEKYISAKTNVLSPSTIAGYRKIQRCNFESLRKTRLCELTLEQIQIAVNDEAENLSPKSVRNAYGLLSAALILQKYNLPKNAVTMPQKEKKEIIVPSDVEMKLICENADKYKIAAEVRLAAFMGLRRSEIAAIKKNDINTDDRTLYINQAMVISESNEYVLKGTKSNSSTRTLSIPDVVFPYLLSIKNGEYKIASPDKIEKKFIELRDSLGLKRITFHSLRHFFASNLIIMNIPDFYSVKLMGHSTDAMLKNVYQHINKDYLKEVNKKMNDFYTKKSN